MINTFSAHSLVVGSTSIGQDQTSPRD